MGAATWYWRSSQERRRRSEPAAAEVLVLPLRTHQMVVELSQPLRKEASGSIIGIPIQSWATCPASSKSLIVKSPPGLREETSRAALAADHRWRHT
jgi:hypothetical protein